MFATENVSYDQSRRINITFERVITAFYVGVDEKRSSNIRKSQFLGWIHFNFFELAAAKICNFDYKGT